MSPDGRLAVAGGYGMYLNVYSTSSLQLLQTTTYTPRG